MGWTPAEVRAASLADFTAAMDGWVRAQGIGADEMTPDDVAEVRAMLEDDD